MEADRFAFQYPTFLILFAAGNSGPNPFTVVNPASAKNVLTVGASYDGRVYGESYVRLAEFSSRGPTLVDMRYKPDIICPGSNIR
jgi:hypothetical protein